MGLFMRVANHANKSSKSRVKLGGVELDIGDVDALQTQRTLECSSDAHGCETSKNLGVDTQNSGSQLVRDTRIPTTGLQPTPTRPTAPNPPTLESGEP